MRPSGGQGTPEIGIFPSPGAVRTIAEEGRFLDERGVASLWVGDHWDSLVNAGSLAVVTQHAAIGTAIAQISRPPTQMAITCNNLQAISNNRFRLGLGLGSQAMTEGWHGIPWRRRTHRLIEYVRLLRALLTTKSGQPMSFEGEFYTVRGFRGLEEVPPPPIWLAAGGPRTLEAAGQVADGVLLINLLGVAYYRSHARNQILHGLSASGRTPADIKIGFVRYTAVDTDRSEARERARASLARSAMSDYHQAILAASGFAAEAAAILDAGRRGDLQGAQQAVTDEMLEAYALAGTPDDLRSQVAKYSDDADLLLIHPAAGTLNPSEQNVQNRAIADALTN